MVDSKNIRLTLWCIVSAMLFPSQSGRAQNTLWKDIPESNINAAPEDRLIIPLQYRTLRLDFPQLKNLLANAPNVEALYAGEPGLELTFPLPDGRFSRFRVWAFPVMEPELAAQYPDIQSFAGKGIDVPTAYIRFDISPNGLHAMLLRTGIGAIFIDPYARGNTQDYTCHFKKDFVEKTKSEFICAVQTDDVTSGEAAVQERAGDCGNLHTYRLALACTGEYANFFGAIGANKAPALAAMNTSMTRVNGVYEIDLGIHMNIVANDVNIIYTDPASDPYTNNNGSTMLGQNQTTCDGMIGTANYDIGHVFSTGGGGIAQLNSPCSAANKAKGVTGSSSPVGDNFDIDYVVHEMGHQFGANHTQYNNCNRNNATAMEPGSASSIMGYAGICAPDVQPHSDAYFHGVNLSEIGTFIAGSGGNCDVLAPNGNSAPVVTDPSDRTIPKSTPYVLSAVATDPNGDALTYCWEQMTGYTSPAQTMPPVSTNTSGPMFRTFDPTASSSRYFPRFSDVLTNTNFDWEELSSVARTMTMRVTVRDNHAAGGCTSEQNMILTVNGTAGPFLVTQPNTAVTYSANSVQTITWNVAGTTAAPVSCANVSILISYDGGGSFSTLLASTPNDGSQTLTIPGPQTTTARIMIASVGNVFYDISDVNFTISAALPVELADFKARSLDHKIRLDWSTASEKDNLGFHIERSEDNTLNFKRIAWMAGHGNSSERHEYSIEDANIQAGGIYYYRLAQEDNDGSIHYSDIKGVTVSGLTGRLLLSPNPANSTVQLLIPGDKEVFPLQVRVWNAAGQLVLEQVLEQGELLPVAGFSDGVYLVQAVVGAEVLEGRFVKW